MLCLKGCLARPASTLQVRFFLSEGLPRTPFANPSSTFHVACYTLLLPVAEWACMLVSLLLLLLLLQVAVARRCCMLPVACGLLLLPVAVAVACCVLRVACCLQPAACCMLLVACCCCMMLLRTSAHTSTRAKNTLTHNTHNTYTQQHAGLTQRHAHTPGVLCLLKGRRKGFPCAPCVNPSSKVFSV